MKFPFSVFCFSVLFFLSLSACKNSKNANGGKSKGWEFAYAKGACFGRCPVYKLSVNEGGHVTFDGLRFVPKSDTLTAKLNKGELKAFNQMLKKADMQTQGSNVDSLLMDAPRTTIYYTKSDVNQKLEFNRAIPDDVKAMTDYLRDFAMRQNWLDDPKVVETTKHLLVELKPSITPEILEQKFTMFKIQVVDTEKGNPAKYKITWNPERIPAMELLNVLRLSDEVETAVAVKE